MLYRGTNTHIAFIDSSHTLHKQFYTKFTDYIKVNFLKQLFKFSRSSKKLIEGNMLSVKIGKMFPVS